MAWDITRPYSWQPRRKGSRVRARRDTGTVTGRHEALPPPLPWRDDALLAILAAPLACVGLAVLPRHPAFLLDAPAPQGLGRALQITDAVAGDVARHGPDDAGEGEGGKDSGADLHGVPGSGCGKTTLVRPLVFGLDS